MKAWLLVILLIHHIVWTVQEDDADDEDGSVSKSLTQTFTYEGVDYIFFTERVTWDEANVMCPSYQARLAVVRTSLLASFLTSNWAASDMVHLDSMWIGARKHPWGNWSWTTGDDVTVYMNWPEWRRSEFREGKDCLALMLYHHREGVVADLSCDHLKPFICEKSEKVLSGAPMPTHWVSHMGINYVLYNAHYTWHQAVGYCRVHGMRIAKFRESYSTRVVKGAMTKSRPSLEMMWIGGHYVDGKWVWVIDGSEIPPVNYLTVDYPPWTHDKESAKGGCVVFDKHNCQEGQFVTLPCARKRSFVCEEYDSLTEDETRGVTLEFPCGENTCVLVDLKSTWVDAQEYCEAKYVGDLVKLVNKTQTAIISDAMADHPNEIIHVWIGGHREEGGEWKWVDDTKIPPKKVRKTMPDGKSPPPLKPGEEYQFPPWCMVDVLKTAAGQELCLNLDRTDYREYVMYGLPCNETQAFICVVGKNAPKSRRNRSTRIKERSMEKQIEESEQSLEYYEYVELEQEEKIAIPEERAQQETSKKAEEMTEEDYY